jgi:hypothetical protein
MLRYCCRQGIGGIAHYGELGWHGSPPRRQQILLSRRRAFSPGTATNELTAVPRCCLIACWRRDNQDICLNNASFCLVDRIRLAKYIAFDASVDRLTHPPELRADGWRVWSARFCICRGRATKSSRP